jgi:hypothetical protein
MLVHIRPFVFIKELLNLFYDDPERLSQLEAATGSRSDNLNWIPEGH